MAAPHKLCMIPGPVEFHEDVLAAMASPALSHIAPSFIDCFGRVLENLRHVLLTKSAQPFVVAGSGTLGWDLAVANLIEKGDKALVHNTGVFGDRMGDCLATYGAEVSHVRAPPGHRPSLQEIEQALTADGPFRMITITHVDTSTGVLTDIQAVAEVVRRVSPDTLILVDGVCSVAAEPIRMDDWGIDVVTSAGQKALGTPPGLAVVLASERAMRVFNSRKTPVAAYFASWNRWLPIMQSYEKRTPSYFGTPPVQLIMAMDASLKLILSHGMEKIFAEHAAASDHVKQVLEGWGLKLVPQSREAAAHAMTAVYYPEGVAASALLSSAAAHNVVLAGGLHPTIAAKYFRIGHMGITVYEPQRKYIETTLDALKKALVESGYQLPSQ
ncbi:pyridoxal phosphate-dependent transferase [Syncephalis pseudoplumigaleata]|uniref:alanine--glyoxylate transaminase n=1 Tax=Syncephalis pseudoplumigaleata TaxID=1712513 RepID=A0A4V1J1R5_9FUNG|nr:pyridoxal phosphate-dependent transferase [Syncephalis pseudoplumigaleata]|eukprot:RKP25979.1 pyridoxal phosphate-dependent transferase [Syncephalis pseudoplumigaleata]